VAPSAIVLSTVRLAGTVGPDPTYSAIVDSDHDGIPERQLRFAFGALAPRLVAGTQALSISGQAAGREFHATAGFEVRPLQVVLYMTPRTFNRGSNGQEVKAQLTFRDRALAGDVQISSIRLNGVVPV